MSREAEEPEKEPRTMRLNFTVKLIEIPAIVYLRESRPLTRPKFDFER